MKITHVDVDSFIGRTVVTGQDANDVTYVIQRYDDGAFVLTGYGDGYYPVINYNCPGLVWATTEHQQCRGATAAEIISDGQWVEIGEAVRQLEAEYAKLR